MYREAAPVEPKEGPPRELVYIPVDADQRHRSSIAVFQIFSLPLITAVVVTMAAGPNAGGIALVLAAGFAIWWMKKTPNGDRFVLAVESGELVVRRGSSTEPLERFALDDLVNVSLDSKIIQRVLEGSSAIPAVRFINTHVAPESTTSRVILVGRDRPFVPLGQTYLAHMEATEWLGKIRVFLRRHGWVPEDERDG
jgi:hypothetical protein